ncbi:uncharacterized protein LOC114516045 [Dendronephthya gigantea]|uniref:uncharacterized protein LOC114516045 n=1 Tax=Dendronephthya gigantea TaxID=151771 RepID=UPI00106C2D5E|nr:uncharacterized protein LOC114516045 [Dendronephthya gigantea]
MASKNKMDIFKSVNFFLRQSEERMRRQFNKAAVCINDLFMTMSNYDVRFHFDPVCLDDCRCEMMSMNQVNLLCTMKEFPRQSCVLEGDVKSGAVMIRIDDHYTSRPDMASWEDIIIQGPTNGRYLSTTKLLQSLMNVIERSIQEISQESQENFITCRSWPDQISLFILLDPSTKFRVNLLPMIRMRRSIEPFRNLDKKIQRVFQSFHLQDENIDSISLVAKPNSTEQQFLWRITFNDLENRILSNPQFLCAMHCLYVLDKLRTRFCKRTGSQILRYHLQTVLLAELQTRPHPKYWTPKKFQGRLKGVVMSLRESLRARKCLNVFTEVNVFSYFDDENSKLFAELLSKFKADQTQLSNLF